MRVGVFRFLLHKKITIGEGTKRVVYLSGPRRWRRHPNGGPPTRVRTRFERGLKRIDIFYSAFFETSFMPVALQLRSLAVERKAVAHSLHVDCYLQRQRFIQRRL